MPRFAAIDMGSNASRLVVAEADDPRKIELLSYDRVPVRLGHGVFLTGRLDEEMIAYAVETLRRFHEKMEDANVDRYRAVVTASAREADNGPELLQRARSEAGIVIDAIDGSEEARLVRLAVQRALPLERKRALLMDLGGGSLELTEVDKGPEPLFSTSLEIGTVRLLESFLGHGAKPVSKDQETLLTEYLERMLAPIWPALGKRAYDAVVGTGGNFEVIAELCPMKGHASKAIDVAKAQAILPRMVKLTSSERRAAYGLRADRADVIVPALYVLLAVARAARTSVVLVPGVGLKDGILAEVVEKHFRVWDYHGEENDVFQAAIQLGKRYQFDETHATQVSRIACDLFDALEPLHKLGPKARLELRVAALLHDIGDFIHFASHHKHSQYIIESSDLMGFSPDERVVVGCVARYHRRALPSPSHVSFKKLPNDDRALVRKLAALLRLADALDREHRSKVRRVAVDIGKHAVTLRVRAEGDLSLERWTVGRKSPLFEQVFRRKLVLDPSPAAARARSSGDAGSAASSSRPRRAGAAAKPKKSSKKKAERGPKKKGPKKKGPKKKR